MRTFIVFIKLSRGVYIKRTGDTFSILMPPPNITGSLTVGHILNKVVQDTILKTKFQLKLKAVWVPGADHAGISTQNQVVKNVVLMTFQGSIPLIKKHFFKREVFKWSLQYRKIITDQLKQINVLCSWNSFMYSCSRNFNNVVLKAFVSLYLKGFIYKHIYVTNWCFESKNSLSDEGVYTKNSIQSTYKLKYSVVGLSKAWVYLCTSRIETLFGDSGLCFNRADVRYERVLQLQFKNMFNGVLVNAFTDDSVITSFGSGVVKLTPGHSKKDMLVSLKFKRPSPVNIFTKRGLLNFKAGNFTGLGIEPCKKVLVSILTKLKFLKAKLFYSSLVSYTKKYNFKVQPLLSTQWFLKYPKVLLCIKAVKNKLIGVKPHFWSKIYVKWLLNIRDWCVSRQSWWGHKIPVSYDKRFNSKNTYLTCSNTFLNPHYVKDTNKLDTWFSSWLWNLTTSGWLAQNKSTLIGRVPTYSIIVTGSDIIFFWIVRMVVASLFFLSDVLTQRVPFRRVYFTGILRDSKRNKISKSLGNSPDIEKVIRNYGMDLLKISFLSMNLDSDLIFKVSMFDEGKRFISKIKNSVVLLKKNNLLLQWEYIGGLRSSRSLKSLLKTLPHLLINSVDQSILNGLTEGISSWNSYTSNLNIRGILEGVKLFFKNSFCNDYLNYGKRLSNSNKSSLVGLIVFIFVTSRLTPYLSHTVGFLYKNIRVKPEFSISNYVKLQKVLFKNVNFFEKGTVRGRQTKNIVKPSLTTIKCALNRVCTEATYVLFSDRFIFEQYLNVLFLKTNKLSKPLILKKKTGKVLMGGGIKKLPVYTSRLSGNKKFINLESTYSGSMHRLYIYLLERSKGNFEDNNFIKLKINKIVILKQKDFNCLRTYLNFYGW